MADILLGLDLGKRSDFSALVDVYRYVRVNEFGAPETDLRGENLYRYWCPRLYRWPKQTDYSDIVKDVAKRLQEKQYPNPTRLVIDATGVGGGVVEMFANEKIPNLEIIPVLITAGRTWSRTKVCKSLMGFSAAKYLIASQLQAVFNPRHINFEGKDPLTKLIVKELMGFQVKLTPAGNEKFEHRDGEHDDLVLALATTLWVASLPRTKYLNNAKIGQTAKETRILETTQKAEEEAEKKRADEEEKKRLKEWHRIDNPYWWSGGH